MTFFWVEFWNLWWNFDIRNVPQMGGGGGYQGNFVLITEFRATLIHLIDVYRKRLDIHNRYFSNSVRHK